MTDNRPKSDEASHVTQEKREVGVLIQGSNRLYKANLIEPLGVDLTDQTRFVAWSVKLSP